MLKNDVPVAEYLLVTKPVLPMLGQSLRERAADVRIELDDLGLTQAYYVDLRDCAAALPPPKPLPMPARLVRHVKLICRSVPYILGLKKPCVEFKNVPDAVQA